MQLKAFHAKSMADALLAVKKDLGPDAVIVRTRSFKVGGVMGVGSRPMVEIVATVAPAPQPQRPAADRRHRSSILAHSPEVRQARTEAADDRPSGAQTAATLRAAALAYHRTHKAAPAKRATEIPNTPAQILQVRKRRSTSAVPAGPSVLSAPGTLGAQAARELAAAALDATLGMPAERRTSIEDELGAIKRMVGQVIRSSPAATARDMPEALFKRYLHLLEQEVARDLTDRVIGAVRDELTPEQLRDDAAVGHAVLRHLAALIPIADSVVAPARAPDGRPFTVALVGPTGVGKTTTIAKLAAAYHLRHGRKVGLITCDTYRIAAVDQLRTYAEIIGIPLSVVATPEEMAGACERFAPLDAILIDTPGRSPRDGARLGDLRAFLDAANPHETHLVLSGASCERGMLTTAERFALVKPNRIIFTKLDEAVNYGVLLTALGRLSTSLSFVTTGQEVPDNIESGRAERLARLVLEGGSNP